MICGQTAGPTPALKQTRRRLRFGSSSPWPSLDRFAERDRQLAVIREEITLPHAVFRALKNLPKRPRMNPNVMTSSEDKDTDKSASGSSGSRRPGKAGKDCRRGRGPRRRNRHLHRREVTVGNDDVPKGTVHKGNQDHTVRNVVFNAEEVTYRREVWEFPGGSRHVAPLPPGVATGREQYGPGVKALVITLYCQCQSTIGRMVLMLNDVGLDISAHQVRRFPNMDAGGIIAKQQEELRAGMETATRINVDDSSARRKAENGYCTAIGNDFFAHFRSTGSKGRLDFLEHLCAGEGVNTLNDTALDDMGRRNLSGRVIALLVSRGQRRYRKCPTPLRKLVIEQRFDQLFGAVNGDISLNRLLERLKANKDVLLRVLDHPETPLHTNQIENDIQDYVTRRKISFGTRSVVGQAARDAYTGAKKSCKKLGLSFWDFLRNRLGVAGAPDVPRLADLIMQRSTT